MIVVIRILLAALIGAAIAGATAWIVSANEAWVGVVIPTAVVASTLIPLVLVARSFSGAFSGPSAPSEAELGTVESEGRLALARVLGITRTGTTINDQPMCDIDLLVAPRYGGPFQVRTRRLVDLVEIPRVQPGSVVVVAMEKREPSPVAIVMTPPHEWQRLAETDRTVRDLPSAPPFTPSAAAAAGKRKSGLRRINPVFYILALLLGAGLALIPAYSTIGSVFAGETTIDEVRHASSWEGMREAEEKADAEQEAAANMFVSDNAARAVDSLVELIGGTQVTMLNMFGSTASIRAPSAPGAATLDDYLYVNGAAERSGAASDQPEPGELEQELFDLDAVDLSLLPHILDEAARLSGIDERDPDFPDQSVFVDNSVVVVNGEPVTMLVFTVPVDGEYYDAWLNFDMQGTAVSMRGGVPGSESYLAEHGE